MSERAEPRATIEDYDPARDNEQCLALERAAPQGEAFRLSFRRSSYHRRAENFDDHRLLVARLEGLVVGVAAVAFKDVLQLTDADAQDVRRWAIRALVDAARKTAD